MDTLQTRVICDRDGWHASTRIALTPSRILDIRTRRHSGTNRLTTHALVSNVRDGFITHAIGDGRTCGDFSRHLIVETRSRITEHVVRAQHAAALAQLEQVRAAVAEFYEAIQQAQEAHEAAAMDSGARDAPGA